jgi:hypothetical protein
MSLQQPNSNITLDLGDNSNIRFKVKLDMYLQAALNILVVEAETFIPCVLVAVRLVTSSDLRDIGDCSEWVLSGITEASASWSVASGCVVPILQSVLDTLARLAVVLVLVGHCVFRFLAFRYFCR